jgi:hypothetical protein
LILSLCLGRGGRVLVEVDAAVGEFAEGSLLLDLGSLLGVLLVKVMSVLFKHHNGWLRKLSVTHVFIVSHDCGLSMAVSRFDCVSKGEVLSSNVTVKFSSMFTMRNKDVGFANH